MSSFGSTSRLNVARVPASLMLALSFSALSGCASLQEGLNKAVLMDYDQTANFKDYVFLPSNYIQWGGGASESGISAYYDGSPVVKGFWATFIICSVRNEGSAAENFPFKMENFYVTYDGQDHYYKPLAPNTFSSYPLNLNPTSGIASQANQFFRYETNLGPENDTFQADSYTPSVHYRFAIHVIHTSPGVVPTDMPLSLRYKDYPNIMNSRNHPPQTMSNPTKKADLDTVCRPPA